MSQVDQTVYTCDRCGLQEVQKTHKPNGDRAGAPERWSQLDSYSDVPKGHLCPRCSDSYREWWEIGGAWTNPEEATNGR